MWGRGDRAHGTHQYLGDRAQGHSGDHPTGQHGVMGQGTLRGRGWPGAPGYHGDPAQGTSQPRASWGDTRGHRGQKDQVVFHHRSVSPSPILPPSPAHTRVIIGAGSVPPSPISATVTRGGDTRTQPRGHGTAFRKLTDSQVSLGMGTSWVPLGQRPEGVHSGAY